jgi:hypothetical protein
MGIRASKNKVNANPSGFKQATSAKAKGRWKEIRTLFKNVAVWRSMEEEKINGVFASFAAGKDGSDPTTTGDVIEPENIARALSALGTSIRHLDIPKLSEYRPTTSTQQCLPNPQTTALDQTQFKQLAENAIRWRIVESIISQACLNAVVAPFLPKTLFEILNMSVTDIGKILRDEDFINSAAEAIHKSLLQHIVEPSESEEGEEKLRAIDGSPSNQVGESQSVQIVLNQLEKFQTDGGFISNYGDKQMFDKGLEVGIGLADPFILKAILREHISAEDSEKPFLSAQYKTESTPLLEFARLLGTEDSIAYLKTMAEGYSGGSECRGPTLDELDMLQKEFDRLAKTFSEINSKGGIFPGEVGDSYDAVLVEARIALVAGADAKQSAEDLRRALAKAVSEDSGVLEPLRLSERRVEVASAPAVDGPAVRVVLVVPLPRRLQPKDAGAEILPNVRAVLHHLSGAAAGRVEAKVVGERSYMFCEYGDERALRKALGALTDEEVLARAEQGRSMPNFLRARRRSIALWGKRQPCVDRIVRAFELETAEMRKAGRFRLQGRRRLTLRELMAIPEVVAAKLRVEEAIVAYQYTGPLFKVPSLITPSAHTQTGGTQMPAIHKPAEGVTVAPAAAGRQRG